MKHLLTILFLAIPSLLIGQQINFEDGFDDGDFTNNPTWTGDTDDFIVTEINSADPALQNNNILRLNAGEPGASYLSTPSGNVIGYWEFFVKLDFAPSNNNRTHIYLMSDIEDLTGNVNGYALRAGENGSDDVFRLFKVTNGTMDTEVLTGTTKIDQGGEFKVKVTRDADGEWSLEVAEGYSAPLVLNDTGTDNSITAANYFGFTANYTTANVNKFYYDFKIQKLPFEVTSYEILSDNELELEFNKDIDQAETGPSNFVLNPGNKNPSNLSYPSANTIKLVFADDFAGGENELLITNLQDEADGTIMEDTTLSFYLYYNLEEGDVIINEIMYDQPAGTPEYVELKNTSNKYLNLKNWKIGNDRAITEITNQDLVLLPDSFIVFTRDPQSLEDDHGAGYYINFALPQLRNSGDEVRIFDANDALVDSVNYAQSWGGTKVALERRSATAPSNLPENWGNSPSVTLGTPGRQNLIEADTTPPELESISVIDNTAIDITFSKAINATLAEDLDNYVLTLGVSEEFGIPAVTNAELILDNTVRLTFAPGLPTNGSGNPHRITILETADIFGNITENIIVEFKVIEFDNYAEGDVIINEIMYDQPVGTPEYIELKNTSNKYLNLKNWKIGNDRTIAEVSNQNLVLHPDSFIVFTRDSQSLEEDHGAGYYINFALPQLKNAGDEVRVFDANDALVDSVNYAQSWGGTKVALERRSAEAPSNMPENWGDSPSQTLGTPGRANLIDVDTVPPEIENITVVSPTEINIEFNEAVKAGQAEDVDNYVLVLGVSAEEGTPEITEANLLQNNMVQLIIQPELPTNGDGNPHKINILQMEDIFGNLAENLEVEFKVIKYSTYKEGDVVINEIMYDQPTGTPEYVELKNTSGKYLNLQDWEIANDRTFAKVANQELTLEPNGFLVFTTDPNTLTEIHGEGNYISFALPALRNAGDQVRVFNEEGALVDSLEYAPDWGGKKVALERIRADLPSTIKANWGDSPNPNLGTPGKENEIEPDTETPKLLTKELINSKTVKLTFSKALDKQNAVNHGNFSLNPAISIQSLVVESESLTIGFATALNEGDTYILTAKNLTDIFGNEAGTLEIELRYLDFTDSEAGDVVINEIMYLRNETDDPQFVELFNISDKNIDLGGWILRDAASVRGVIPAASYMAPGEYLVLTDKEYFADSEQNIVFVPNFPSLNRAGDAVALIADNSVTVDTLYYFNTWGGEAGVSLERKDPYAASNDASNWATSTDESGSTPGRENSRFEEDNEAPRVIFASQKDDGVFVAFSEFISIRPDTEFKLNGSVINDIEFDKTEGNKLFLKSHNPKLKVEDAKLEISNLYDFKGNKTATAAQPIAMAINPGSVVINELLFEAHADANDNLPDQTQYLELYNPNDYAISLEGLVLTKAPDETGKVTVIEPVSSDFKWIPAKEYMLIYADNEATEFKNSKTAIYFELEDAMEQFSMRVNRTSLSLKATGDDIYIADSTGTVIDSVRYSRDWHNPNKITTKGTSLEKINPAGPSSDPTNWSSSADSRGGTPGAQNSIYQESESFSGKTGISFSSNPFSPDNDGFEDNLIINYELNHPDYLLHVRIFDRYGRKVRTLADGKPAGYNGNLIWDGLTDDRRDNRVGIYIVLFEAYNSAAGKKQVFKETVVLARQF